MLQGQRDLSCIETSAFLREANVLAEMEKDLTAVEEVSDEVEGLVRLERVVELHNEGMGDLLHDVSLNLRVIDLAGLNDEVLLERLDSIDLLSIFLLCHVHFTERAPSHDLHQLKVADTDVDILSGVQKLRAIVKSGVVFGRGCVEPVCIRLLG